MIGKSPFRLALLSIPTALGGLLALGLASTSCSDDSKAQDTGDAAPEVSEEDAGEASFACTSIGLGARPFSTGPYGTHRGEVADDFTLPLVDGTEWSFKANWSGCDVYVFVPDNISVSDVDSTPVWEKDLDGLVEKSPKNVHYFFISKRSSDGAAAQNTQAMQERVDGFLSGLSEEDAAYWRPRLHVVATRASALGNWVGEAMKKQLRGGFVIDRRQRIRGLGSLADVRRRAPDAQWPWESNLAYAANEAIYWNAQEEKEARLDADGATVVKLFDGEVLEEFAEKDVTLPSVAEMATFDTLEIQIDMACPNPDEIEFNNCGPWDYLAHLFLWEGDDAGAYVEVARFITSYHRETSWIVDATPTLARLKDGGTRHFKWSFAPPWNKQPTATKLALRFSNQNKGYKPTQLVPLYDFMDGRKFNVQYNDGIDAKSIPIPTGAKKVELRAIVTGHGNDGRQCAEFCNHQHEFTVNGDKLLLEFKEAGTVDKCVAQQTNGMVPNQGGTWWTGRGGWCPGQQVNPWIQDVTSKVSGGALEVSYRGLYRNAPPTVAPPDGGEDDTGNIVLDSYVVVYQ